MSMHRLSINMVSESAISVKGHGVHTAYVEMTQALKERRDCEVLVNQFGRRPDVDVTHIHTIFLLSLYKLLFGKGVKVVSAHIVPDSFIGSIALARYWRPLARWYLSYFYSKADKVLAVSQNVALILERELNVPKEKIAVLCNTVNMAAYATSANEKQQARQRLGIRQGDFLVVGNGQVQPRKRLDTFIHVAKSMPNLQFIWIGGIPFKYMGAEYTKMREIMSNLPDNVKITGVVELSEVKHYFQAADAFMLPSEQETFGIAIIEAAGAGLPIVLRDEPVYDDTFKQDVLRCKNDEEFLAAIQRLCEDGSFYEQACQGAKNIAALYDSHAGAERLMQIYHELLTRS